MGWFKKIINEVKTEWNRQEVQKEINSIAKKHNISQHDAEVIYNAVYVGTHAEEIATQLREEIQEHTKKVITLKEEIRQMRKELEEQIENNSHN
jgi:adenylate cyclase class IV